ncbi:ATP-binding cassette domain-containing protein [Marinobacter sp. JSM 1782161]|uniref:ATP-binding cassette domain-containing protein n=1 Tax=Marinobacter sp. JSM 1782161 TaxID=2685906 RepID=UPI001403C0F7|nr:ATP-binding cassette domain-containing protein [Marinobacter sp. JSM 1782161]
MLDIDRLTFRYPGAERALTFSVRVDTGTCLAITGPSGCGKSTLLNLVAGFLEPTSGHVRWQDHDIDALPPWERPVTSVFQEDNLFDHLSVRDNLAIGIHPGLKLSDADETALSSMLADVGLAGMEQRLPTALSGGQRQRIAIARALLRRSPLLLLDEPLTGLDPDTRATLLALLDRHKAAGTTLLLVSHDTDDVQTLADDVLRLTA